VAVASIGNTGRGHRPGYTYALIYEYSS